MIRPRSKKTERNITRLASVRAVNLIERVCGLAGSTTFLEDIEADLNSNGVLEALAEKNTPTVFDWLMASFSFQGISDRVASSYMKQHGSASWHKIKKRMNANSSCPRLHSFWTFDNCRYDKGSFSCSTPDHIRGCAVPSLPLRNGRLNQTAFSFFLFTRDIAGGDLTGWIDSTLAASSQGKTSAGNSPANQLIDAMRGIYGVSDKILSMSLSALLLGGRSSHPHWFDAGASMITVDTLVHNFLHRTGILEDCGTSHSYGPLCYAPQGCAEILRSVAQQIDARRFSRSFPAAFPRFVQHAVWRYCAADGKAMCNGNRIDDRKPCEISYCHLFNECRKLVLKPQ